MLAFFVFGGICILIGVIAFFFLRGKLFNTQSITSFTLSESFFVAFPPNRKREVISTIVTIQAPPRFPTIVSASICPITFLSKAIWGRFSSSLDIRILPRVSCVPFLWRVFPLCRSFLIQPLLP